MRLSKKWLLAALCITALVFLSLFPQIRAGATAVAVAVNVLVPTGDWRPLQWTTRAPVREKQEIHSISGRTLTLYLYRPARGKTRTGLVIYTPLIGPGPEDPRLINLADTFARSGFTVVIPWRAEEQQIVTPKDVGDVVSTALFLHNQMGAKNIGLMGLSYGNGPVIVAAADPALRERVSFVVSFAGYYDLGNTARFVRSGAFAYKEITGALEPDPYARDILDKTLAHYGVVEEEFFKSTKFEELRRALSPSTFIDRLPMEFFILHSTDDRYIPYTESLRLTDALAGRVPVNFALTTIFEHGDYKKLTWENVRNLYLQSVKDFYIFIYRILRLS